MLNFQDLGPRHIAGCRHMNSNSTSHISEVPGGIDTGSGAIAAQINESIIRTMVVN